MPTRMFAAEKDGEWEPLKIREKNFPRDVNGEDIIAKDLAGTSNGHGSTLDWKDEEVTYEEDPISDEGAVYPLSDGHVVNWPCFFGLLTHVYNTLGPPFHTPILVIAQPAWTLQDHETLTQFFFEKFKTPAFCLMDSALATCYAYATSSATVIDVGYTKCDVSAVRDFLVNDTGRGTALPDCGGEAMTRRLFDLLESKGFNREMCEQLKKNVICEVLPPGASVPVDRITADSSVNPTSVASTGATGSGDGRVESIAAQGIVQSGPGIGTEAGDKDRDRSDQNPEDEEGVLDVASIVASGKTSEFLAQKDREKAAKSSAKKTAAADAAAAAKLTKLPNSKKPKASFYYHERKPLEELTTSSVQTNSEKAQLSTNIQDPTEASTINGNEESSPIARKEERREERRRHREGTAYIRKEIDVGVERFEPASGGVLDQIADAVHRCILSVPEINKRSELWDSLIVVGNGSKVRGMFDPRSFSLIFSEI